MRRNVLLAALLLTSANAIAQISDEQAFELAREFASRIPGAPIVERPTQVGRRDTSGLIDVFLDGNAWVTLTADGRFLGYADMRRKPAESGDGRFATEEEAWRAAEALVAKFDAPEGLVRERIKGGDDPVPVVHCIFETRPNGYPSHHGASVSFQRSDGAVLNLTVFPGGWTYEPPNIRVTEQKAKEIAAQRMGGEPAEWESVIKYAKSTPDLKRRGVQKTQRLVYSLYRPSNRDGIIIDTVTAEIVTELRVAASAPTPVTETVGEQAEKQNRELTSRDPSESTKPTAANLVPFVALAFVSLAVLAWLGRKLILRP